MDATAAATESKIATMIRRRGAPPPREEDSSSDEEDAFTALSRKSKKAKTSPSTVSNKSRESVSSNSTSHQQPPNVPASAASKPPNINLPVSTTSSMKRHHGSSDSRKAKMEALLQELEADKGRAQPSFRDVPPSRFVPDKRGSFVEPWEAHTTTNIFVGNLAPSITEEELADLFRQFGDLHSVKVMWPRTIEERSRNRNTGFVCFMNRADAEQAMDACHDRDPFRVGRHLLLRWGKNLKTRGGSGLPMYLKRSPSSAVEPSSAGSSGMQPSTPCPDHQSHLSMGSPVFDPALHGASAIRVVPPSDPRRFYLISTVASFVSSDGAQLERKLIEREAGNPEYSFLRPIDVRPHEEGDQHYQEQIFYRWRVYSFCQGDGFYKWRTEPFVMLQPNGRFWIPPPAMRKCDSFRQEDSAGMDSWRGQGRDSFDSKRSGVGGGVLTEAEHFEFDRLVKKNLCASRTAICQAMAFCFENSSAATEIAGLLKQALLDESPGISVETRVARLYLLSDVLFNSQQPGVRNAFLYRDAVERMAPEVFTSLGKHGGGRLGRMTMNKLRTAVSAVLGAWTNWSVYSPTFLDDLQARFEGRKIKAEVDAKKKSKDEREEGPPKKEPKKPVEAVSNKPRGGWTEVGDETEQKDAPEESGSGSNSGQHAQQLGMEPLRDFRRQHKDRSITGQKSGKHKTVAVGRPCRPTDEVDGEPLSDDGEPLGNTDDGARGGLDEVDGEPLSDDGEPLEDDGGEPLREDEVIDGEPLRGGAALHGQPFRESCRSPTKESGKDNGDDVDGEPLSDDGVPLGDGDASDGELFGRDLTCAAPVVVSAETGNVPLPPVCGSRLTEKEDGEPLQEDEVDGDPLSEDDGDGEPLADGDLVGGLL